MKTVFCPVTLTRPVLPLLLATALPFLSGCGSGTDAPRPASSAASPPAASAPPSTSASLPPFVPVDACALLTRADVEAAVGRKALDGRKEEAGELVTCSFGDPDAPKVGDRPLSQLLTVSVMTGREGAYYAGPVAQVRDVFQMARKNAASPQAVSGLGDDAYWDSTLSTLSVVKNRYLVDVAVQSEGDKMQMAKAAAAKALARLPQ